MLKHKKNSHEFSLHWPDISNKFGSIEKGETFEIDDAHMYHRVARVLRLQQGEAFVLFDQTSHMRLQFAALGSKKTLVVKLIEKISNVAYKPAITLFFTITQT